MYKKPKPKAERSPITNFARVIVAAAYKITQPFPKDDDTRLHRVVGEEIQSLSPTCILGCLHKAAIVMPGEIRRSGSWKLCSVSEVESDKALICLAPIMCCFIMCGVVHSTGNTYFLEQASHMKLNIGKWKPPLQLMLLISAFFKSSIVYLVKVSAPAKSGDIFTVYSVVCCAVAAGVEKRRIKVLRKHNLLDLPDDGKVPMSAWWLTFQFGLAGMMEPFSEWGFAALLEELAPKSIKRYHDCLVEGVSGFGFLCTALSVYVVGKVSEAGGRQELVSVHVEPESSGSLLLGVDSSVWSQCICIPHRHILHLREQSV
ncbi:hypothetical protein SASPL_134741 [Salvia splendens]|uniref:Uncharacterized protein n=1 Tax=Salvia splendens TaxID=180675 RepID=A0A8X8WYA9_SALSN|nr:hypothetical protein SASPL_134741 [Salvia splendens]